MNRNQQRQLIAAQVAAIQDTQNLRVLHQGNEFELHFEVTTGDSRKYHLVLVLEDYDIEPPKLLVLDESGRSTWDPMKVPPPPFRNGSKHPIAERDFFCVPGTYDYHTHPLHEHELWDAARNTTPLAMLVGSIVDHICNSPQTYLVQLGGFSNVPLRAFTVFLTNGKAAKLPIPDGVDVGLRAVQIRLADTRVIQLELLDGT